MVQKRIFYVARKSLLTNGCFACHDIPGTGRCQADRAQPDRMGTQGHRATCLRARRAVHPGNAAARALLARRADRATALTTVRYFWEELQSQSRIGFMFQKLSEPRSFDFQETQNKKYTARLRMPQFPLTPAQREAVMTFVLGLVSDPPTEQFAYQPDQRTRALIDGQRSAEQVPVSRLSRVRAGNLAACLPGGQRRRAERSRRRIPLLGSRATRPSWPRRGKQTAEDLRTATIQGMPALGDDGRAAIFDEEEFPLEDEQEDAQFDPQRLMYGFDLWLPTVLDGWPYQVGDGSLVIPSRQSATAAAILRRSTREVPAAARGRT